jgi:antitoxin YefM
LATFRCVESFPFRIAKDKLSALLDQVERTHERVTITRNGRAVAVLVSPEDLAALEETLDVLADPVTMARVRAGQAELDRGEGLVAAALRDFLDTPAS